MNTSQESANTGRTIGVVTDDYVDYQRSIIDIASGVFAKAGYRTVCFTGGSLQAPRSGQQNPAMANESYRLLERCDISGIVAFTAGLGRHVDLKTVMHFLDRFDVPVVSLGVLIDGVPSILAEEESGMRDLMVHVLSQADCQRVAYLRGVPTDVYSRAREALFRECMLENERQIDEALFPVGNYNESDAYNATCQLLTQHPDVDAIVAANDLMALSAARAALAMGFRVPDDIAITGFDDAREATQHSPALTTVRKPVSEIATASAEHLLELIADKSGRVSGGSPFMQTELKSVLVVRRSTPSSSDNKTQGVDRVCQELVSAMASRDLPGGVNVEDIAVALASALDSGTCQPLLACIEQLSKMRLDSVQTHWVRDLCQQIDNLATDYLAAEDRSDDVHVIRGVMAPLREALWTEALSREFEGHRLAEARSSLQVQLGACVRTEDMLSVLDDWLVNVSPERFYLVQYEQPAKTIPESARLLRVAHDGIVLPVSGVAFDTAQLLPTEQLQESWHTPLVFYPVFSGDYHHGYVLINAQGLEQRFIDDVLKSLGNAMQSQHLIHSLQSKAHILKATNDDLSQLALSDPVTGLANRRCYDLELRKTHERCSAELNDFSVVFLDLDGFKLINDTLGHESGDQLLLQVATRLEQTVHMLFGERALIARHAGDEFTLLAEHRDEMELRVLCATLLDVLRQPFELGSSRVSVTASLGYAIWPDDATDTSLLLRSADAAMYEAKMAGKNRFMRANVAMLESDKNSLKLAQDLRVALANNELTLHYQPRVDLETQQILGVEALMRWYVDTPDGPAVKASPAEFIPVAERAGLIVQLDNFALFEACRQAKAWVDAGTPLRMSINMSVIQLQQDDFVELVLEAISREKLDAGLLELEITESVMMSDVEANIRKLEQLRDHGVRLSIDDFGTGYSSLSYLKRLPVTCLKVDRAFIKDIDCEYGGGSVDAELVKSVVSVARSMKFSLVAEGIETDAQRKFSIAAGIDEGQGFYFAKPQPAHMISQLLDEDSQLRAA